MRSEPERDINLAPAWEAGSHSLGPGRYETIVHLGSKDGLPMFTFTSDDAGNHPINAPSAAYLRTIAVGLRESHGWTCAVIGRYLARFPGAAEAWTGKAIEALTA